MSPEEFKKYFAEIQIKINRSQKDILRIVGNDVRELFRKNFESQGFFGKGWYEVNRRKLTQKKYKTKGGKVKFKLVPAAKGAAATRKILHGQGRNLSRSLKIKISGNTVTISSDLAYSAAHNEGTENAGRSRNVKIPQRQFMGNHPQVESLIKKTIETEINKILKP